MLGKKFNRLTIVELLPQGKVLAVCECGVVKNFRKDVVVTGHTKSCGCARKKLNYTLGQKFNRLTIQECLIEREVLAICDCGKEKKFKAKDIVRGKTKSCGCYNLEKIIERKTIHGLSKLKIFKTWRNMLVRCYNKKSPNYRYYGGRGITVCERWHTFDNFFSDMGDIPENLSIDRVDVDKGYSKENCRWADDVTQARNKRKQKK